MKVRARAGHFRLEAAKEAEERIIYGIGTALKMLSYRQALPGAMKDP